MASEVLGPPLIAGYRHLSRLGRGGFADVFLYEQASPRREVAIKVLFADATDDLIAQFTAEADVMAQLSGHSSIVSIYQAGVSDDGRPYLVMEYCPGATLAQRAKTEKVSVAEALRIGIQIAGAVETAHRAGILHRDIKPDNVLTNAFNRPKLTDFGVAHTGSLNVSESGISIPWSPPELFDEGPTPDPRSDVYSLGATVFHLLAGRSPFEIPGGDNSHSELMRRIARTELPLTGRPDVQQQVQQVCARAMAKNPERRYDSALGFARALQETEIELGLTPTSIEVLDAAAPVMRADSDDALTRIRPIAVIRPEPEASVHTAPRPTKSPSPRPSWETPDAVDIDVQPTADSSERPLSAPSRGRVLIGGALVAVVAVVVALVVWIGASEDSDDADADGSSQVGPLVPISRPLTPTNIEGEIENGRVVFTWVNPDPRDGDSYQWRFDEPGLSQRPVNADEPRAEFEVPADGRGCIVVWTVRSGQASDPSPHACPEDADE